MYAGGPENQISRRNLLVTGMSLAAFTAASMVQGCGSENFQSVLAPTGNPNLPDNPGPAGPAPVPPAFIQPVVISSVGTTLSTTLTTQLTVGKTVGVTPVVLRSYNGELTGPTLRVKPGDKLRVLLSNKLPVNPDDPLPMNFNLNTPHEPNTTNLHTHGLHVSPQNNSDNIFVEIPPNPPTGTDFQYEYNIPADHPPGTMWYHPHKHGSSSTQLFSSMAGALIIEGGLDDVPEIKQARDLVYLITEVNLDNNMPAQVPLWLGAMQAPFPLTQRKLLVNGTRVPTLSAFSGEVVRLRVINGTTRTAVPFQIVGHTLNVISLDGIALPTIRKTSSIVIPPAGRTDVLIQCGAAGNYDIQKGEDTSVGTTDPLEAIGQLTVLPNQVFMNLPKVLPPPPYANITTQELTTAGVAQTLTFAQVAGQFPINGVLFNKNVVNISVPLNAVQEWVLINTSPNGHPFHIHINPFMVMSITPGGGVETPLPEPEWHDTINIPKNGGMVRFRTRFEDFKGMFVLHCHILVHEDLGMMQVVEVT